MSRSTDTVCPRAATNRASSARCMRAPRSTGSSPTQARTGPRTVTRTARSTVMPPPTWFYLGCNTEVPTYGTSASGTRTLPSGCWWFSRIATSQRVVASVPLRVAAVCGLPFSSR